MYMLNTSPPGMKQACSLIAGASLLAFAELGNAREVHKVIWYEHGSVEGTGRHAILAELLVRIRERSLIKGNLLRS
jgi:hypothetical protein